MSVKALVQQMEGIVNQAEEIDYYCVEMRLNELRKSSVKYLKNSLKPISHIFAREIPLTLRIPGIIAKTENLLCIS